MTRAVWTCAMLVATAPAAFAASSPAQAIAAGRAAIEAQEPARAVQIMQDAIPGAAALGNPKERSNALAALHFYSALAFSEMERDDKAREELREFFRFHQGESKIDESRYPVPFVRAFNEVASRAGRGTNASNSFEVAYPGYNDFSLTKPRETKIANWNQSAAFRLLATDAEQREWDKLADDDARAAFASRFWQRRDTTPGTEQNELREEFERRAAFADDTFGGEKLKGSLSDRGRIFILVGTPRRVTERPITGSRVLPNRLGDLRSMNRPGSIEHWVYDREQLPVPLPLQQLDVTFIDDPNYGDHVLQQDAYTIKELDAVRKKYAGAQ
jgi:GWxTD domain-containing protein